MTDRTHQLSGLEADNLLSFLTLLGLLRSLEVARPGWRPRVAWHGSPPVALLYVLEQVTQNDVIIAADEGIRGVASAYSFDRPDITHTPDEFFALASTARRERDRALVVSALSSDGAKKRNSDAVVATPLCAMFGQGHQHFLSRLTTAVTGHGNSDIEKLQEALFEPWRYDDNTESFRWDPIEDRRYALQFGDPSEGRNKIGTVTGANRLAAVGFPCISSAPVARGLATIGVVGDGSEVDVCWPLVDVPTSLAGHLALLAHPDLGEEGSASKLAGFGVHAIARARRFLSGKFFNFERARLQLL